MLGHLPVELLHDIIRCLLLEDVKSLSSVSKLFHSVCAPKLWKSIRIDIPRVKRKRCILDVDRVAQCASALQSATPALRNAKHLTFSRDLRWSAWQALHVDTKPEEEIGEEANEVEPEKIPNVPCLHVQPHDGADSTGQEKRVIDGALVGRDPLPVDNLSRLCQMADSVLERIPVGQLDGFSWDLATCISSNVLDTLHARQPQLRSLRLITDGGCLDSHKEIPIAFRHLTHISWHQPPNVLLGSLGECLKRNREHLTELDVTLAYPCVTEDDMDVDPDHGNLDTPWDWLDTTLTPFSRVLPETRPLFPVLTVLSLNNVSLGGRMKEAIDITTVKTVTIRNCHLWERLLERSVATTTPLCLEQFEIQSHEDDDEENQEEEIIRFLSSFRGLKELFLGFTKAVIPCSLPSPARPDPSTMIPLWDAIAHHHATLKKLVVHQRGDHPGPGYRSRRADPVHDGCHFDIPESERDRWKISPTFHPMSLLDLECLGFPYDTNEHFESLKEILGPFALKSTLKILHFRQTGSHLKARGSRALEYPQKTSGIGSSSRIRSTFRFDKYLAVVPPDELEKMVLPSFARHLDWIFGPRGISSLEVVAFGDFAHGRNGWALHNLFVCRQPGKRYRVFDARDKINRHEWIDTAHKYKSFLESCPIGPLVDSLEDRTLKWWRF